MFSLIGQLTQHTGARILELPVPGAAQLPPQAPPTFQSVGMPYYTTAASLGIVAPLASSFPQLSPLIGIGVSTLLASTAIEPVSASVA